MLLEFIGLCVVLIGFVAALGACGSMVSKSRSNSYDDTDPPGGRSGLVVLTDHLTGQQYLSSAKHGGLTPRLPTINNES